MVDAAGRLGDCLFGQGRKDEAHPYYVRAKAHLEKRASALIPDEVKLLSVIRERLSPSP